MSTPTQKQALEEAQLKITELEGKVSAAAGLQAKLDEANGKVTAAETALAEQTARADKADKDLQATSEKLTKAESDLEAASSRATKAEEERDAATIRAEQAQKNVENADQRHAEQLASHNINPVKKAGLDATDAPGKPTAAQLKAEYNAIEDKDARYAFFQKHKAVLMA